VIHCMFSDLPRVAIISVHSDGCRIRADEWWMMNDEWRRRGRWVRRLFGDDVVKDTRSKWCLGITSASANELSIWESENFLRGASRYNVFIMSIWLCLISVLFSLTSYLLNYSEMWR
jgi:hypothetical protein